MAREAWRADSSAQITPCCDSGSKAAAASPTANQPVPATRVGRELLAATTHGAAATAPRPMQARVCRARSSCRR